VVVSSKKAAKKASAKRKRTTPKHKVDKFVENIAQGKKGPDAVIDAGWNQSRESASVTAHRLLRNAKISEAVEKRKEEAMRRAQIHTDVIVGSLAEIATASLADVLDENGEFDLEAAREKGTDHLIKKLKTITFDTKDKDGNITSTRTTHEYEMYSRLDALGQLRDNFGMKQEARPNSHTEVEQAIQDFMRKAKERGYEVSFEEARTFIEPRMVSDAIN
jgi:phage terminase small subunit